MGIALTAPIEQIFPPRRAGETSPFANIFQAIKLPPFTAWEARQFIAHRLQDSGLTFDPADMDELVEQSGGHPATLVSLARRVFARVADL